MTVSVPTLFDFLSSNKSSSSHFRVLIFNDLDALLQNSFDLQAAFLVIVSYKIWQRLARNIIFIMVGSVLCFKLQVKNSVSVTLKSDVNDHLLPKFTWGKSLFLNIILRTIKGLGVVKLEVAVTRIWFSNLPRMRAVNKGIAIIISFYEKLNRHFKVSNLYLEGFWAEIFKVPRVAELFWF